MFHRLFGAKHFSTRELLPYACYDTLRQGSFRSTLHSPQVTIGSRGSRAAIFSTPPKLRDRAGHELANTYIHLRKQNVTLNTHPKGGRCPCPYLCQSGRRPLVSACGTRSYQCSGKYWVAVVDGPVQAGPTCTSGHERKPSRVGMSHSPTLGWIRRL